MNQWSNVNCKHDIINNNAIVCRYIANLLDNHVTVQVWFQQNAALIT